MMQKNKLIRLLKTLEHSELRKCKVYIVAHSDKKTRILVELFDRLRAYHPTYSNPKLEYETLFYYLFPGLSYNRKKLYKIMTDLGVLVEDYIVWQSVKSNSSYYQQVLRDHYSARNRYQQLTKISQERIGELDTATQRDIHYYRQKVDILHSLYFHQSAKPAQQSNYWLQQLITQLDHYYWLAQLRYACEVLARKKTMVEDYNPLFLQQALQRSKQYPSLDNPLFKIYSNIIQLHQEGYKERLFQNTEQLFYKNKALLSQEERPIVLQNLINILYKRSRDTGDLELTTLHQLHQFGLKENLFVYSGKITDTTFINIVATGAALQHFAKMKHFMDEYGLFLGDAGRSYAIQMANAYLHFYRGFWSSNYREYLLAQQELNKVETKNPQHEILKRSLLVRITYEAERQGPAPTPELERILESFASYLKRKKKVTDNLRLPYQRFVLFVGKLNNLTPYPNSKLDELETEIVNEKDLALKFWLKKKVRELRG